MSKRPNYHGCLIVVDAKKTIKGVKESVFRVKTLGVNGKTLQISETLNTPKSVSKHLKAMQRVFRSALPENAEFLPNILDKTRKKIVSKIIC